MSLKMEATTLKSHKSAGNNAEEPQERSIFGPAGGSVTLIG